jgi:hypothetical protein
MVQDQVLNHADTLVQVFRLGQPIFDFFTARETKVSQWSQKGIEENLPQSAQRTQRKTVKRKWIEHDSEFLNFFLCVFA